MAPRYTVDRIREIRREAAERFAAEPSSRPARWMQSARRHMPGGRGAASSTGGQGMGGFGDTIRRHPIAFALLGVGLGWLLVDRMRSGQRHTGWSRHPDQDPFEHHVHVSESRPGSRPGMAPDADMLIGRERSRKSAEDSARTLLEPDGRPLEAGRNRGTSGGETTVGWAQPERNAGQSVRTAARMAEELNRAGGLPGADNPMSPEERARQRMVGVRDDTGPVFDRP